MSIKTPLAGRNPINITINNASKNVPILFFDFDEHSTNPFLPL
ncbi:MAG: hypothetical protein UD103_05070 [Bacteroidales bacterium]|nr:hypothetical protein [Bacteroidales bacterium]